MVFSWGKFNKLFFQLLKKNEINTGQALRQIAEGIKGAIFFFQNEDILVDTNSELDCGVSYQPRDLLDKVGFRSI